MRIIAGKYRRRILKTSPGLTTRPYTDRVKETLFENISQRLVDARVADIFAGTGTMGLEALSRGARKVTFIEKDRIAVELLKANIAMLECQADALVWPADVYRCSFRPKGDAAAGFSPFDAIFFDPPYDLVPKMVEGSPLWLALGRLARAEVSSSTASLILRIPEHTHFDLHPGWTSEWTLDMSRMQIHVCRRSRAEPNEA